MRDFLEFVGQVVLPVAMVMLVLFALVAGLTLSVNQAYCNQLTELGHETRFEFWGGCYVRAGGQWVPVDNWRVDE